MSAPVKMVDREELTSVIRKALRRENTELGVYTIHPISYDAANPVSGGVYRITGTARIWSQTLPWSLVLKVVRAPEARESKPGYWPSVFLPAEGVASPPMFWKREPLAYQSGLLSDLPRG